MKKVVSLFGCIAFTLSAYAAYTPIPLTSDSYNYDSVVENAAPKPVQTLVTANMDAGTNIHGLFGGNGGNHGAFYETGFIFTPSGLPFRGTTFNAFSDTNHTFRMPTNYTGNNAVFIGGAQSITTHIPSGTLTLSSPETFKKLSVLNAAGSGPATVSYTVHFQDGSNEQGTFIASDWLSTVAPDTNTTAVIANGNFTGNDGNFKNFNQTQRTPRLFYNDLALINTNSPVTSVDFSYTVDNRRVAIFGLSGSANGTNFSPLAVTGFNHDMIIESAMIGAVTATCDGGTNKNGNVWYEVGFAAGIPNMGSTGLPAAGTTFAALSNANISFQMPFSYATNNTVMLDTSFSSGGFTLDTPASFTKMAVLGSASGNVIVNYLVIHTDFSTSSGSFTVQNQSSSTSTNVAFVAGGRANTQQTGISDPLSTNATKVYYHVLNLANTKPVAAVNLSQTGSRSWFFALSGETAGSGALDPIPIKGFNFDMVLEREVGTFLSTRAFTTATIGNGTNNNGYTFYERGWNDLAPASGLPLANALISSTNLTDRQYQLAPSYSQRNVIMVDSNNPVANITFTTPTNYTALSFLNTASSGPVQAEVVVHFEDGSSETNALAIRDWFNGNPAAFTSGGYVYSDFRSAVNWVPPAPALLKLFDGHVGLENLNSKVTGATIRWTTNNSSGGVSSPSSRISILAATGAIPEGNLVINADLPNAGAYQGTNVTLSINVNGGLPITYQWQSGEIGSGIFTNVFNSGIISGANSGNLTFTGIDYANSGDYRVVMTNPFGSITSSVSRVVALSPLPNILKTNDPIQIYGGSSSFEVVTRAIDGTLSKHLNFGLGNTAAPFDGPVGLTVTPALGETVVSALRIFAAGDAPERDPSKITLEGSNNGTNWTLISSNSIVMPNARNGGGGSLNPLTQILSEVRFTNSVAYTSYRFAVHSVKTNSIANSMQIAELQLLGVPASNPPAITNDIPALQMIYAGDTMVLPVGVFGTPPLTFQWKRNGTNLVDGVKVAGAQTKNLSITSMDAGDAANYQLFVTNAFGGTSSTLGTVSVQSNPEFNVNGTGWTRNGTINAASSPATITSNILALTTGVNSMTRSAFFNARLNVTAFYATYTYHNPNAGGADGAAFILHNDPRGATALGAAGGSLGASDIKPGLSIQFNIFNQSNIGINTNGFVGNFRSTAPVNLASGRPIDVAVLYYNGLLELTLSDTNAGTTFSTNMAINLPSAVGGNAAYVGFSGATGGIASTQNILNFQFTPLSILTMDRTNNTAQLSWPAIGSCVLQSSSDLTTPNWITAPGPLSVTNATFQWNTTLTGTNKFYRLKVSNP